MSRTRTQPDARERGQHHGMNWCRQDLRLAIHLRDGLCCAWCGDSVENGAKLSLDHVIPHSKGGSNHPTNLVTACTRCNSSRGNRSVEEFAGAVAGYINHGVSASEILSFIEETTHRPVKAYRVEAKAMISRRGSAARVLASM